MEQEVLRKEYDMIFDNEERALSLLGIATDSYTKKIMTVELKRIGVSLPTKIGRKQTVTGLTESVKQLGIITPINVMTTENYAEKQEYIATDNGEDTPVIEYILIDGFRRFYAAHKTGLRFMEVVVWDFKDKDKGKDLALALGLMINRHQKRYWGEIWELYKILELQGNITPNTLEYLLELEPGDAMKLKDVMLSDYIDLQAELLDNVKNLEQSYRTLQKLRKEEDTLAKEDAKGLDVESAEGIVADGNEIRLTDEDVRSLLEMDNELSEEASFDDLNRTKDVSGTEYQTVGERHRVDPAIKQGTFQRDEFTCKCCGTHGYIFLGTLIYHHVVPVHCGGPDSVDNGITLCDSCHQVLHIYEQGRLPITKELFEKYTEPEQKRIKLIMKYGNVAIEASKRNGSSKETIVENAKAGTRHRMPGESLKDMNEAYKGSV